jgi:hypothetical protein
MDTEQPNAWDRALAEYQSAFEQYRHFVTVRRQDLLFVTTIQGAVLTIIRGSITHSDPTTSLHTAEIMLSLLAFFVVLLGLNNERRLSAYMEGCIQSIQRIEKQFDLKLFTTGARLAKQRRLTVGVEAAFTTFYIFLLLGWMAIWALDIWCRNHV